MRRKLMAAALVVLAAGACSTGDTPGLLLGSWGGSGGGTVAATRNGVVISLPCSATIRIVHPVIVGESGEFIVLDSLRGSLGAGERDTMPVPPPVVPVLVDGTVQGDHLSIALGFIAPANDSTTITAGGAMVVFDGQRGQAAGAAVCRL